MIEIKKIKEELENFKKLLLEIEDEEDKAYNQEWSDNYNYLRLKYEHVDVNTMTRQMFNVYKYVALKEYGRDGNLSIEEHDNAQNIVKNFFKE